MRVSNECAASSDRGSKEYPKMQKRFYEEYIVYYQKWYQERLPEECFSDFDFFFNKPDDDPGRCWISKGGDFPEG